MAGDITQKVIADLKQSYDPLLFFNWIKILPNACEKKLPVIDDYSTQKEIQSHGGQHDEYLG